MTHASKAVGSVTHWTGAVGKPPVLHDLTQKADDVARRMGLRRWLHRALRTYPIRDDGGVLLAFEVDAQLAGQPLNQGLR
jgi:hypothetical protein